MKVSFRMEKEMVLEYSITHYLEIDTKANFTRIQGQALGK